MPDFSKILLTVDFDRTLTGPDSKIPERNIEAIRYFMDNGGTFTVNTGRSTTTFAPYLETLPRNAPLLLYNGSAAYDKGELMDVRQIDLDPLQVIADMRRLFPEANLELQGADNHYLIEPTPNAEAYYKGMNWGYAIFDENTPLYPFMKFCLFGQPKKFAVSDLFDGTEEELRYFEEATATIAKMYEGKVEVMLAAPRILDVQAIGVSKCAAARNLQKKLGKEILVCVGDAHNDIAMLDGADYAFCPADAIVADRYETVCECGKGAIADVIYEKIPMICEISLDS